MKTLLSLAIAIMAFAAVTVTTQAQSSQPVRAQIPFAFHVSNTELAAGEYSVTVLNRNSDQSVLQIKSLDGRTSAIIHARGTTEHAADKSILVFHQYGESYFFAQLQIAGESALTTARSKAERIEAKAAPRLASKPVVAIVNTY